MCRSPASLYLKEFSSFVSRHPQWSAQHRYAPARKPLCWRDLSHWPVTIYTLGAAVRNNIERTRSEEDTSKEGIEKNIPAGPAAGATAKKESGTEWIHRKGIREIEWWKGTKLEWWWMRRKEKEGLLTGQNLADISRALLLKIKIMVIIIKSKQKQNENITKIKSHHETIKRHKKTVDQQNEIKQNTKHSKNIFRTYQQVPPKEPQLRKNAGQNGSIAKESKR